MFDLLFTILSFLVAILVIVAVHEYGHYRIGRLCGIKADVFSIGMGKPIFFRTDRHGTRWQIAPFPIGGFVMFRGDSNSASTGTNASQHELSAEELRETFHGAPLWARAATILAGPLANFVFSALVFTLVFMFQGRAGENLIVGQIAEGSWQIQELQPGDEILAIGGVEQEGNLIALEDLPDNVTLPYLVRRGDQLVEVLAPFPAPAIVGLVMPRSAASDAGLKPGDHILAVNGMPIHRFEMLRDVVEASAGEPLALRIWREGNDIELTLSPRATDEPDNQGGFRQSWRIGVSSEGLFSPQTETLGPIQALTAAFSRISVIISSSFSAIGAMIQGQISTCNLSGPFGMAEATGTMASQGTSNFIMFVAVLSVAIGMFNLFPIPVLDGGHLALLSYEAISGKPPHPRFNHVLTVMGLAIIIGLMIFATLNDIACP